VQLAKLNRMKQYADALLSQNIALYFGELVTEIVEIVICKKSTAFRWNHTCSKALSAIIRLQETEPCL
jgi:hypothetical protein